MITKLKPVKVPRRYAHDEWRPTFAFVRHVTFSVPGAPKDANGNPERMGCWVFMEWIETKSRDHDNMRPWIYRLRAPA